MLYLIIFSLAAALFWLGRRHMVLMGGIRSLEDAVRHRRPFLSSDEHLSNVHQSWRGLAAGVNEIVTEVNRLEEQRQGELTQLETTLGCLQEAVLVVDQNNYILLVNKAMQTIFPSATEVVGQRVEVVLKSSEFIEYLDAVREGTNTGQREMEFIESSGSTWVEVTGSIVPGSNERGALWALFVLHDITQRKKLEVVRKEFVANVSHELKTPLSIIKGYAETLVEEHRAMDGDTRAQFLETTFRHAQRLTAIVEDLLVLSRLESGKAPLEPEPQDFVPLLRVLVEEVEPRLSESGHAIKLEIPSGKPVHARFDRIRLSMVFANLIDNAQKYTPRGSTIRVGLRADPEEREVEVWVQDDGPGIPSSELSKVFARFYRVEKGRSRETGGTGLGLSIVKHIIQLHGGRVWAESEVGKGTRVAFRLPLLADVAGRDGTPVAADERSENP